MARFDRKILLPYLRDLYSVELLVLKRQKQYQDLCSLMHKYEQQLENDREPEAEVKASAMGLVILSMVAVVLCVAAVTSAAMIRSNRILLPVSVFLLVLDAFCIVLLLRNIRRYQKASARYATYQKAMDQYQSGERKRVQIRSQISECKRQIVEFAEQSNELGSIRHSLYSANVIPASFRTVHAVRYLFHYFQSSKADDVDMVLQIFAIQELKQEHKVISRHESDMILHQRMIMANQIMTDSVQRQNVEQQMLEIANSDQNQEFRNQYLKMISINQDVSNFFCQQTLQ